MSLQPMPVRSAMRAPGRLMYFGLSDDDRKRTFYSHEFENDAFDIAKHVWFGHAPELNQIIRKEHRADNIRESVGPQRLPFEHLWLEGVWPKSGGGMNDASAYAVYCHSNDARDPDTLAELDIETTTYQIFGLMNNGFVRRMPVAVMNVIDDKGLVQESRVFALAEGGNFTVEKDRNSDIARWALSMVMPAMWAIGLMNCKNVHLDEVEVQPRTSRNSRRKRPKVTFHTIILPGSDSAKPYGRGGSREVSQHQVRGHFKTFTPEAPLLGRHTGTYWWGWQVRGNKKNGVVVSDYKVGASTRTQDIYQEQT